MQNETLTLKVENTITGLNKMEQKDNYKEKIYYMYI